MLFFFVMCCLNFVRRHGIKSIAFHGQAASATFEEAADDMAKLRERLRELNINCTYNVDETGDYYNLVPKLSYATKKGDRKTLRKIEKCHQMTESRHIYHYR